MGNNGENMINEDILKLYAGSVDPVTGKYSTANGATDFSSLNLKNRQTFATYMDGVSMSHKPSITFDNTANGDNQNYIDYTSYIGSFYCGGNVGSMTYNGTLNMPMTARVIVYDKIVGGCNSASVKPTAYNAAYDGGIIGASNEENYIGKVHKPAQNANDDFYRVWLAMDHLFAKAIIYFGVDESYATLRDIRLKSAEIVAPKANRTLMEIQPR